MNRLLILSLFLSSCNLSTPEKGAALLSQDTTAVMSTDTDSNEFSGIIDSSVVGLASAPDTVLQEFSNTKQLLEWLVKTGLMKELSQKKGVLFDSRLAPAYLQADFNGDGNLDISIPVKQIKSGKFGFVIVHGHSHAIHIIGAGTLVKNGLSDDLSDDDEWSVNHEKINEAGLEENTGTGKKGELILENPSLNIEKSGVGGGLIYWNGKEYAYFHQTC